MRIRAVIVAAAAAAGLLAGGPAGADKRDFEACDGLRAPGTKNGGMSGPKSDSGFAFPLLGSSPDMSAATVAACGRALADPRLTPTATLRRVHLLRARALARLQGGDADGALGDLDAAAQAAGPLAADPLYARSMGVSLTLARAGAWQAKGDRAKARALAAEAAAARPYSSSIQSMAALIVQRARDPQAPAASFTALMPLMPDALSLQFGADVEAGRFAEAAALHPRLKHEFSKAGAGSLIALTDDVRTLAEAVIGSAQASYAYAATGQGGKARAVLADAKAGLDAALVPGVDKKGAALPVSPLAEPLRAVLERYALITDARLAILDGAPMNALKALVGAPLPVSAASVELLTALRVALPEAQRALAPDPAVMAAKLAKQRAKERLDLAALRKAMPAPETSRTLADYEGAGSAFLASFFGGAGASNDGFRSRTDEKTGVTTVEFVGQSTSAPAVEEMTLLRAADLARAAGRKGILIVDRRDFARTMTVTRGYSAIPISSTPAGYKTELKVRFVDPASPPADLSGERDRLLDADRVYAALAPIYIPAAGAATASR